MKKLFLIDAFALIFRFYYAFLNNPMRNAAGVNTSAVFGFTRFINTLIATQRPDYIAVAFDPRGGNFRHDISNLYKANRSATPEDILASVPYIKSILEAMNIAILEVPRYEADDVIGTVAKRASIQGLDVYMVTPDKDFGQLIEENIKMYKPRKGFAESFDTVTKEDICAKYSIVDPLQVIDILALWGDASDNVQGIPGIGEKSAIKLIKSYGSIDGIYNNIDEIKGKQRENLIEFKDTLMLARELVTICLDVPIDTTIAQYEYKNSNLEELKSIYVELNFHSLIRELGVAAMPQPEIESSLFPEYTAVTKSGMTYDMFALEQEVVDTFNRISNTDHTYTLVNTQHDADLLADLIEMNQQFCFDTETTGLNTILDSLVGISISMESGKAYYIPYCKEVDLELRLKPIFENPNISKIGQNIKFDILVLKNIGIEVRGTLYDTMIMQYIINPDLANGMDFMALSYLNYETIKIEELIGKRASQITMDKVPLDKICDYACEDADITIQLKEILWKRLTELGLDKLYMEIEEPLITVLSDIEHNGVMIDKNILTDYSVILEKQLAEIDMNIREFGGEDLNINSPRQLGELLFDKLKIVDKPKKTKTKQYKTDEEYLQSLKNKHEVVEMILDYRGIKKLLSTYVLALVELINPKTGRVHTTYNQALTRTGRLSSNNPNLQNIPIRTPRGEIIRKAFVAQGESRVLVAADYSQVELRIMAHLSQDPSMIEAFNLQQDIHSATAAKIYKKSIDEVEKEERSSAKSANFGIIYGISEFGLAGNLNISREEARVLINGYFESYPGVRKYMDNSIEMAREKGYAETIYHRRRYLEDINSSNANVKSFAERNAINAPIQGSAADIMKIAMVSLHRELARRGLKSIIILQVHDELVLEVEKSELEEVMQLTRESMQNAAQLLVPLTVEVKSAKNWLEAH